MNQLTRPDRSDPQAEISDSRGFGVASVETNAPVTPDTLFRIASFTKTFVAAAVVELSEQGRLRLDAPIDNYIYGLNPEIGRLTAHQLLSHTAGLSDDIHFRGPHEETALAMVAQSLNGTVLFTRPGRVFSYSNLGYVLLGRLISSRSPAVTGGRRESVIGWMSRGSEFWF